MSIVLRDVGLSLVGGLVLPHEGTIQLKHIRSAGEQGYCIRSKFISNQNSWIITKYNTTSKAPYILAKLCTIAQT